MCPRIYPWLHHDHQGSIQAITDATGTEVQRFLYYPYGDRIATATAHDESKGWIGERQDATGLFYLHARYYDPVIGRFNSADPSDPMLQGVGLNRYDYAGNNPVMRTDPWGLRYVGNDEVGSSRSGGWKQVRAPSSERGRRGRIVIHGNDYSRLSKELGRGVVDDLIDREVSKNDPGTYYSGSKRGLPEKTAIYLSSNLEGEIIDFSGELIPLLLAMDDMDYPNPPYGLSTPDVLFAGTEITTLVLSSAMIRTLTRNLTIANNAAGPGYTLTSYLRNKIRRIGNATAAGGNRTIPGSVTMDEAFRLGGRFVGANFTQAITRRGVPILRSSDGLRQFRGPQAKSGINRGTGEPWSRTGVQVNFESRPHPFGRFTSNVHLDVDIIR